jgi:hypothetical protein
MDSLAYKHMDYRIGSLKGKTECEMATLLMLAQWLVTLR